MVWLMAHHNPDGDGDGDGRQNLNIDDGCLDRHLVFLDLGFDGGTEGHRRSDGPSLLLLNGGFDSRTHYLRVTVVLMHAERVKACHRTRQIASKSSFSAPFSRTIFVIS
ncbi:hypothetical protein HAX54_011377, partial [Datura stramonium]|nr:hypothetical protein [Datura stramonium]